MAITTETGPVFLRHKGQEIRHLQQRPDLVTDFLYHDGESEVVFDIRELPKRFFGAEEPRVHQGDPEAHRAAIRRAIDANYHFEFRAAARV